MSWKKFSSNTKRNGSIYASKVFTENIVVHKKAELDSIDISIINYPKDNYDSSFITISDIMKCNDLSVDVIGVHNGRDTSGVVKFIKSISAPAGMFNILKAKDGCFNNVDVSSINYFNLVQSHNNDIIEVSSNSNIFNSHYSNPDTLAFNDVCVNNINETNSGVVLTFLSDICINSNLLCKDISVNVLDCLNKNDFSYINIDDICVNGIIYANEISANNIKVCDLCVNIIQSDTSINFKNNVVCNHDAQAREVYIDNITSDVSINGDVSINSSLTVDKLKLDGNIGKSVIEFSGNAHLLTSEYSTNTMITNDICVNKIAPAGGGQVPTTQIDLDITSNDPEITTYGIQENVDDDDVVVIDGDISYDTITADWEKSGLNIIPVYDTLLDLVAANDIYKPGQIVAVDDETINNSDKLFIKIDDDFWHILKTDDGTVQYKKITLSGEQINNIMTVAPIKTIFSNSNSPDIKITDNSYENIKEEDICVFYLKNNQDFSNGVFTVNIETLLFNKLGAGYSISFDDISFQTRDFSHIQHSNIVNTGELSKWGVDVSYSRTRDDDDTKFYDDFSSIIIRPPVNNGFDLSFHINISILSTGARNSIRKLEFKKLNELPIWSHIKFDVSNIGVSTKLIDISGGDQSWNDVSAVNHKGDLINVGVDDASCVFYVRYFNPSLYHNDVSYYFLDLSAIDPEGYDVSYRISDYITQDGNEDWSWNWSSNDSSRIVIKIPGEGSNQKDFSFTILAHDNSIPDVSNLIPETYYSDDIDSSKRTIFFKKENDQPTWNYMKFGPSNDNIESEPFLDASWNNDSALNLDDISIGLVSGLEDMDLSKHFFIYYDSCRNKIHSINGPGTADLSYYYLDLSATDFEGFDVSYDISCVKDDLSFAFVGDDTSRIVIDISSKGPATLGEDTSLAIISLDDWTTETQRPERYERIANFTYITSGVINDFHISYGISSETIYEHNEYNIYHAVLSADISDYVGNVYITPTIYSPLENTPDISFTATGTNHNELSEFRDHSFNFVLPLDQNPNSSFLEISFNLLLNRVFEYKINICKPLFSIKLGNGQIEKIFETGDYNELYFVKQLSVAPNNGTNTTGQIADVFTFLLESKQEVICNINKPLKKSVVWHFIAGSGGGGGQGGHVNSYYGNFGGVGGGGGASGFIVKTNTTHTNFKIKSFKVNKFSQGGQGGTKGIKPSGSGGDGSYATNSKLTFSYDSGSNNTIVRASSYIAVAKAHAGGQHPDGGARTDNNNNIILPTQTSMNGADGEWTGGDAQNLIAAGGPGGAGGSSSNSSNTTTTKITYIDGILNNLSIPNGGDGGDGGYGNNDGDSGGNGKDWDSSMMIVRLIF